MKRVVSTLDKIEKDLAAYEEERKRYNDGGVERLSTSLGKALERLGTLPPAEEGAAEQRSRADAFEDRIRALVEARGSLGAKSGLDSKSAGKLNALDTKLANLAIELSKFEGEGFSVFNERKRDRLSDKVAGVFKDLSVHPAENHVVAGLAERGAQLEATLQALAGSLNAAQAGAAETEAAIAALTEAPDHAEDLERVEQMAEVFKRGRHLFALDANHLRRIDGILDDAREQAETWRKLNAASLELRAKYSILLEGRKGVRLPMRRALDEAESWRPRYVETVEEFIGGAPAAVAEGIADAKAEAVEAVADQKPWLFSTYSSSLRARASHARNVAALYDVVAPDATPLSPLAAACDRELALEEEKLSEVIVRDNRAPGDGYTGSDQRELETFVRAQWAEHFPEEEVLAVRFPQEAFARTTAWRMESNQAQLTKIDHSELSVRVIVAAGLEAILYRVSITRLHLQAERLILRWNRPDPVPPGARMLTTNV